MRTHKRLKKLAEKSESFDLFLAQVQKFIHWYEVPNCGTKADYLAFYIENKGI